MMTMELIQVGIDAAAMTLLHSLWQAAVVAAVLFVALKVIPRSAAVARYWWGAAAAGVLVLAMAVTFASAFELASGNAGEQIGTTAFGAAGIEDPTVYGKGCQQTNSPD